MSRRRKTINRASRFTTVSPTPRLQNLKGQEGSNLIESALIFMVLMSLLLGIVDFSRALYTYHFLSNVARDATRWAAVNGAACTSDGSCASSASAADIQNYVASITPPGVDPTKLDTDPSWPGTGACAGQNNPGCPVLVKVSYPFTFVVPFIRSTPLTLSSSSEMTIVH